MDFMPATPRPAFNKLRNGWIHKKSPNSKGEGLARVCLSEPDGSWSYHPNQDEEKDNKSITL